MYMQKGVEFPQNNFFLLFLLDKNIMQIILNRNFFILFFFVCSNMFVFFDIGNILVFDFLKIEKKVLNFIYWNDKAQRWVLRQILLRVHNQKIRPYSAFCNSTYYDSTFGFVPLNNISEALMKRCGLLAAQFDAHLVYESESKKRY